MIVQNAPSVKKVGDLVRRAPIPSGMQDAMIGALESNPSLEQIEQTLAVLALDWGVELKTDDDDFDAELAELDSAIEAANRADELFTIASELPEGGIDPTTIITVRPTGPVNAVAANPPPEDHSPAPPPAGQAVTAEDGFDEADLKALASVGDYRFGAILSRAPVEPVSLAAHPSTTFDESAFLRALRNSISLTLLEKYKVIGAIPNLSQYQVDKLMMILHEEGEKFRQLSPKHLPHLKQLESRFLDEWMIIVNRFRQQAGPDKA